MKRTSDFIKIIIFIMALIIFASVNFAVVNYSIESFDQVIYTMRTAVGAASREILIKCAIHCVIIPVAIGIVFVCLLKKFKNISNYIDYLIKIKIGNKNYELKVNNLPKYRKTIMLLTILFLFISVGYAFSSLGIIHYLKNNVETSNFFEENYVNPEKVEFTFPEEKRNLIYIYLESMESTFTSVENGGAYTTNYIPNLTKLAKDNINFSENKLIGGGYVTNGTSWTMGAMIAQTAGIPLKIFYSVNTKESYENGLVNGAYSLGEILDKEGYNQYIMVGSNLTFGGRRVYFTEHGNYKAFDYFTAIEDGIISEDYYVFWGMEDEKLYNYAKAKLLEISEDEEPFNFTLLTVDTHSPDGYLSEICEEPFANKYLNSVYCADKQIYSFINWIQEQDFYENTTIIITGDHLSMNNNAFDSIDENYPRRTLNIYINPAQDTDCIKNREFTTYDYFPTTLGAMGVKIEGEKLGLGTNLFSCEKTLSEIYTNETVQNEISKKSEYYEECIMYNNCY